MDLSAERGEKRGSSTSPGRKSRIHKDISDVIAKEVCRNPSLIPDLPKDRTVFFFSDYSRIQGRYKTHSFLITGRPSADYFNGIRKAPRNELGLRNRRMSYKGLSDRVKLKALPAFLVCRSHEWAAYGFCG